MADPRSVSPLGTSEPFELQVARGQVGWHHVRNIFGYPSAGSTTWRPLWELAADYVYPGSALAMTVTSGAGVADDGIVVNISGLDADYQPVSESVTLNNASPPTPPQGFFRINDVVCISGGNNPGLISVKNSTVTYAAIRANDGRNQASIYTVPAGHQFYLVRIDAFSADSTADKPAVFQNYTRLSNGQVYNTARTTFYANMHISRHIPFRYAEKTDIQFRGATLSGTHELGVFGEGYLIDLRT